MTTIKVGSIIAFNKLPDAVWFEVVIIDGFRIIVRQEGLTPAGKPWSEQTSDKSLVKQIKRA